MHWISRLRNAFSSTQNLRLTLIFWCSRCCFSLFVASFPRLSKSRSKITSGMPVDSIFWMASMNDLPPVFNVRIFPFTPNSSRAWESFFPSTMISLFLVASCDSLVMVCWIFSMRFFWCVDKDFTL